MDVHYILKQENENKYNNDKFTPTVFYASTSVEMRKIIIRGVTLRHAQESLLVIYEIIRPIGKTDGRIAGTLFPF